MARVRGRRTVWLVGMMGAGKSTVGAALARRLGVRFVDTDAEVVREAGASVAEIFEREGETAFRWRERRAIEALRSEPCVVALGGGAIAQPGAADLLRKSGTVVYLRARPESLAARVGRAAGRPLLAGASADEQLERLRTLLAERAPYYESADLVVDTDGAAVGEVVERVAGALAGAEA
jgi:shikimate kinase